MTPFIITDEAIRAGATAEAYQRGREYAQRDAVGALTVRGRTLTAEVEGSRARPYRVTCELPISADGGIVAICSCPYEWGGWCKHIVATLLTYITDPSLVPERLPLADQLAPLTREQLQETLLHIVAGDGELTAAMERYIAGFAIVVEAPTADAATDATAAPNADHSTSHAAGHPTGQAMAPAKRLAPVDSARLRREVKTAIRSADRSRRYADEYYDDRDDYDPMSGVYDELAPFARQATEYVEAGDGLNAIRILEVITDELLTAWAPDDGEYEPEEGYGSSFLRELGDLWTEALLSGEFTRAERKAWAQQIAEWTDPAPDYVESNFSAALTAASEGWDHPQLQRILRDELTDTERRAIEAQVTQSRLARHPWLATVTPDGGAGKATSDADALSGDPTAAPSPVYPSFVYARGGVDDSGDELTQARLRVLARQGRYDEYLAFARLMGEPLAYAMMLAERGRLDDAANYGRAHLRVTESALTLAKALLERGAPTLALGVAERGLALLGSHAALARWLRDLATARNATALALASALALYQEEITLDNYLAAQGLAGDEWPSRREGLLTLARQAGYRPAGPVAIFLHEGLLDDAIKLVSAEDGAHHYDYSGGDATLELVLDAALAQRPDWVIHTTRRLAERIMDGGQNGLYEDAARLLGKAREAYLATNRPEEWQMYLATLLERHRRKYRLTPLLRDLA